METTEVKAKAAIAMLREGLRDFDLHRVARASTELVRTGGFDSESRNRTLQHGRNPEAHFP
jgi:hypothetical protein